MLNYDRMIGARDPKTCWGCCTLRTGLLLIGIYKLGLDLVIMYIFYGRSFIKDKKAKESYIYGFFGTAALACCSFSILIAIYLESADSISIAMFLAGGCIVLAAGIVAMLAMRSVRDLLLMSLFFFYMMISLYFFVVIYNYYRSKIIEFG